MRRFEMARTDRVYAEDVAAKPPRIAMAHMIDPTLHASIQFGKADVPGLVQIEILLQATREVDGVARFDPPPMRPDDPAQPGNALRHRHDLRPGVNRQAQVCQLVLNGAFPYPEIALTVAEQAKIIHVAQVAGAAQFLRYKMVQRVH